MKTVCKLDMCSDCKACVNICNKNAIQIIDNAKTCNAFIDEEKCVNCGLCEKVCQVNNPIEKTYPKSWYQGWVLDEVSRQKSSSGGLGAGIQKAFIENGGVVCSCLLKNGVFSFDFATTKEDVEKFVGSKYVKSDMDNVYAQIKNYLKDKKKVLFVGLPCQCAGLKKYLGNNELLYTVDLICHGTPSQKLLNMFLEEKGYNINSLNDLSFRNKANYRLSTSMGGIEPKSVMDRYTFAFLNSLCYTENCYSCEYASIERVSDITLGDSWGTKLDIAEQKKGVSLVLCNTSKGEELIKNENFKLLDVDLDNAINYNKQLSFPSKKPEQYDTFYRTLYKTKSFNKAVRKSYFKACLKKDIKSFLIKHKLIKVSSEDC